jgi:large subunit ribosomal protein L18
MIKKLNQKLRSKSKISYSYPVIVVTRSNKHIQAQLLEPISKKTLFTIHSSSIKDTSSKTQKSEFIGQKIAEKAKELNYIKLVFDRNGYIFHGRIKAVASSIKNNGILI